MREEQFTFAFVADNVYPVTYLQKIYDNAVDDRL